MISGCSWWISEGKRFKGFLDVDIGVLKVVFGAANLHVLPKDENFCFFSPKFRVSKVGETKEGDEMSMGEISPNFG